MEIIRQFQGTVESVESAARRVGKEEARADAPRPVHPIVLVSIIAT